MNIEEPIASNRRIVTCNGYCEEVEAPVEKDVLSDPILISNRDAQIRHDLESELQWDPRIDDRKIGVIVHRGIVSLTGEVSSVQPIVSSGEVTLRGRVTWRFQKDVAGRLIAELSGVRHVANLIEVKSLLPHRGPL
jgi:osmotically-inducible protein OsmY